MLMARSGRPGALDVFPLWRAAVTSWGIRPGSSRTPHGRHPPTSARPGRRRGRCSASEQGQNQDIGTTKLVAQPWRHPGAGLASSFHQLQCHVPTSALAILNHPDSQPRASGIKMGALSPGARGYASPRGAWVPPRSTARPPRGRASGLTLGGGSGACTFVGSSVPGRLAAAVLRGRQAHGAVDASHVQKPTPKTEGGAHTHRRSAGDGSVSLWCPAHAAFWRGPARVPGSRHLGPISSLAVRPSSREERRTGLGPAVVPSAWHVTARLRGRPPSAQRRRTWGSIPPPRAAQI